MKSNFGICFITLIYMFVICVNTGIHGASGDGLPKSEITAAAAARRVLQGSAPPNCNGKCGRCTTTCKRVIVEVEPGEFVWRCVCAAKLN